MARKKAKEETKEETKSVLPVLAKPQPVRDEKGHFVKGHAQLGHAQKGSRWKYSGEIMDRISTTLLEEIGSEKFKSGLENLFYDDPRTYYQIIGLFAKIAVPTNIDIEANVRHRTLVDERLAILVGKKQAPTEE